MSKRRDIRNVTVQKNRKDVIYPVPFAFSALNEEGMIHIRKLFSLLYRLAGFVYLRSLWFIQSYSVL